jgi:putative SOS response-associated peptidase YedK
MGGSFIDRTDPTFDDLGRREVINVRCKCGRDVQIAPFQLIGQHGIAKHTKVWSLRDLFRITEPLPNWPPNYNVAPAHIMPVVRPIDSGSELAMMEWGLIPFFSRDGKRSFTTFNARSEELRSKPMYREPFKKRRCVVPATGYIEFTGPKGDKTARLFTRTDGKPIALAGLWDRWTSADKAERKETYTVVTTAPSAFAGQFHDRMPMVLELEDAEAWLRASPDHAAALMQPAKDVLQERPLGKAINNVKNNSAELLA